MTAAFSPSLCSPINLVCQINSPKPEFWFILLPTQISFMTPTTYGINPKLLGFFFISVYFFFTLKAWWLTDSELY